MVRISYEVNGRKFSNARGMMDPLTESVMRKVGEQVRRELTGVRCPRHGTHPKARILSQGRDRLEIKLTGCCDELIEAANARLQ